MDNALLDFWIKQGRNCSPAIGAGKGTVIGKEIGELAEECDAKFNTESVISIELSDVTQDELNEWGYPDAKLLPIPSK